MRLGVPREVESGERRVGATPNTVARLQKLGFEVAIERGAGVDAGYPDAFYEEAGCVLLDQGELWETSDIIIKILAPQELPDGRHEADLIREGAMLISFIWPAQNPELLERLNARSVTCFALDSVPRITRAQKCDALSSMANLAGYRAVIEAAHHFGRLFTGQVTAAGKVPPAKVLVIGAGVAGLAAIGAARSLGAIVRAFDTRPAVKEQVESMGADFLELDFEEDGDGGGGYAKVMSEAFIRAEMALFAEQAREVDIIITTALIPGRPAPKLVDTAMVESMTPGSVVVDLAAQNGGNCELTVPHESINHKGISIVGFTDLVSRMATQASQLVGTNIFHLLDELTDPVTEEAPGPNINVNLDDEMLRGALVSHKGEVMWPPPKRPEPIAPAKKPAVEVAPPTPARVKSKKKSHGGHGGGGSSDGKANNIILGVLGVLLLGVGLGAPDGFLGHLTVFVLACFTGWLVVWSVAPALHTPLMSVTNAISGIILIAGMVQLASPTISAASVLGAIAVLVATINVAGGFLVTRRMLKMFHRT